MCCRSEWQIPVRWSSDENFLKFNFRSTEKLIESPVSLNIRTNDPCLKKGHSKPSESEGCRVSEGGWMVKRFWLKHQGTGVWLTRFTCSEGLIRYFGLYAKDFRQKPTLPRAHLETNSPAVRASEPTGSTPSSQSCFSSSWPCCDHFTTARLPLAVPRVPSFNSRGPLRQVIVSTATRRRRR